MMDIDVLHAQIVRGNTKVPWGLQFHGGNGQPLLIAQISAGGPAAKIGIRPGDRVTQVQGKNVTKMTSHDVMALMNQQGCTLLLTVERPASNGPQLEHSSQHAPTTTNTQAPLAPKTSTNNHQPTSSQSSVYRPRPPLWYTPPIKAQPREVVTSSNDLIDSHRVDRQSDDGCHVTSEYRYDVLSDTPIYGSQDDQYEYHTVHAQPFARSGRLTPRQRQNTAESRSSSEADQAPSASSPLCFTPPCCSPSPNYSTLSSSDVNTPQYGDVTGDLSYEDKLTQSRTFRILQSLMFNEAPPCGDLGLPPPRSASLEQQRREEELQRRSAPNSGRQRIRVFMPQQYNSPLSMYSAPNIINTFQDQAEKYFESLERKNRQEQPDMYVDDGGMYEY